MQLCEAWKKIEIRGVPTEFKNKIPVYEVLEEYALEIGGETLMINHAFCQAGDVFDLHYEGQRYKEELRIVEGKIIYAETLDKSKMFDLPTSNLSDEEFVKQMGLFWQQPYAHVFPTTYFNIKRLEDKLVELPFSKELSPVYLENGIVGITGN